MLCLLHQNFIHILRTRLLFLILFLSFLIQFVGIQTLHSATIYLQGVVARVGHKEALFLGLFFELFTGGFLAAVFGIWLMPYAHQGQRSSLTFTLPVSKWQFVFSYGLCMLGLLLVQHLVLLISYGSIFGYSTFILSTFPWKGLLSCLLLETVAFEAFAFAFAVSSMTFGQISTFFLGTALFFVFQVCGAIFRLDWSRILADPSPSFESARIFYQWLPPLGEMVFDLRHGFVEPSLLGRHLILWVVWLAVFVGLFRLRLRYPAHYRSSEV